MVFFRTISTLVQESIEDDIFTLAAALSYYTALSFSPLLLLVLWLMGSLGFSDQQALLQEIERLVGSEAGALAAIVLRNTSEAPDISSTAGIVGFVLLLASAAGVFGQLQYSLNRIWGIAPPEKLRLGRWIQKRLLSFGMVFSLGFIAIVSLAISTVLTFVSQKLAFDQVFAGASPYVLEIVGSILVFSIFFSLMFRVLPDTELRFRQVWFGGFLTATLFTVGKKAIALYLGQSSLASPYGAAGSVIVLLLWVYYSSIIVFIGAEVTQLLSGSSAKVKRSELAEPTATPIDHSFVPK